MIQRILKLTYRSTSAHGVPIGRDKADGGWLLHPIVLTALLALTLIPFTSSRSAASEASASSANKIRWGYYVAYDATSFRSLRQNVSYLDYLSPYWFTIDGQGQVSDRADWGLPDPNRDEVIAMARAHGVKIVPMIINLARNEDFHRVLADPSIRARAIQGIVDLVVNGGYDGINIDFEAISPEDRPYLTTFMTELAPILRGKRKLVTQAIAARTEEKLTGWAGGYDYAALGRVNDLIILMSYGYGTQRPQSTAPFPWVEGSAAYAASQIPKEKLLLGLPWYGYDWNLATGRVEALDHAQAVARAQKNGAALQYDLAVQGSFFSYSADGQEHQVWFEDARSNEAKIALVHKYGLAGVAAWRIGHEDP
ncbi:MAG: spore peptidoglycan hydrolase, partial [Dehalococcoidia bacterium]|nr:spore peptidoglycan hydrolase [Dehalococcoidia bacterium]